MANISPYITLIRTARYGADVRDAIADGIEAINNETEATTASQDSLTDNVSESLANYEQAFSDINSSEEARTLNEQQRIQNEETRQANETARESLETGYVEQARLYAQQAESYTKSNYAMLSKSWAVGDADNIRPDEGTNNSKYYAEKAEEWANVAISAHDGVASFNGRSGAVVPADNDYTSSMITHSQEMGSVSSAINALVSYIGNLSLLPTTDKNSIVGAINEIMTGDIVTVESAVNTLNSNLARFRNISALPTQSSEQKPFFFSVNASNGLSIAESVVLPNYSKGVYIASGASDAVLIATDSSGNVYTGYRNGNTWQKAFTTAVMQTTSITVQSGWSLSGGEITKSGKTCQARLFISATTSKNVSSFTTIATIPAGYRPKSGAVAYCRNQGGFFEAECLITSEGAVRIRHFGTTSETTIPASAVLMIGSTYICA